MPIDPHLKRFLERLAAVNPPSALALTVSQRRSALEHLLSFSGSQEPVGGIEDRTVPGPSGALPARLYTPLEAPSPVLPGLLYFHGGGFVAGSVDTHDGICRSLANASGCRLISLGYRLAPEHPFPAAIEDGYTAACWIAGHADELRIDPDRLGICGDSAGATLAAVVSQRAAATRAVRFALQFLLCPIMDFGADIGSRGDLATGYLLDQATLDHDLRHYLGSDGGAADPRVSPLRAPDVRHLPPTCVHTAEFDPVCEDGRAYAGRLERAGVTALYRCHPGMIHLFYGMGALIPYVSTAYRAMGADIRLMLG